MKMLFGKWKGKDVSSLSYNYLNWVLHNVSEIEFMKYDLSGRLYAELKNEYNDKKSKRPTFGYTESNDYDRYRFSGYQEMSQGDLC